MELWKDAGEMLSPHPVVNLGLSGSQTRDWLPSQDHGGGLAEKRLLPLLPTKTSTPTDVVVFYCGSNDINAGLDAAAIARNTLRIFETIWDRNPDCLILNLEVMAAPQKKSDGLMDVVNKVNRMMEEKAGKSSDQGAAGGKGGKGLLRYVHINDLLSDSCFVQDRLHLNKEGYLRVAERISSALQEKGHAEEVMEEVRSRI